MPKKKKATITLAITSIEGFETALNDYVTRSLRLQAAKAEHEARLAKLNADFEAAHKEDADTALDLENSLALFAMDHRAELLAGGTKSRKFANATVGFRDTPASVQKRISKDTWDAIANRLKQLPWGDPYVDTKISVAKDDLLRDRANLTDAQLAAAGIRFESTEIFYINPEAEALPRIALEPAEETAA